MRSPAEEAVGRLRKINPAELAGRIGRVRRMNAAALSDEAISNRVRRLFDGYASKPIMIRANAVFRARKNENGQSFTNTAELWYPPPAVVSLGRFNAANESVFYAASTIQAAAWEIRAQPGDILSILVCGANSAHADIYSAAIGMHLYDGAPQPPQYPFPDLRADSSFQRDLQRAAIEQKWRRLDDYLSSLATAQPSDIPGLYRITNVISRVLTGMGDVQGLTYPSVATALKAFNLRLQPQAADQAFFPGEVWEFEVLAHVEHLPGQPESATGYQAVRPLRRSARIEPDGAIVWLAGAWNAAADLAQCVSRVQASKKCRALET